MKANKAVVLLKHLMFITLLIFFTSCSDDNINNSDPGDPFEIKVWNYSDVHYFVDTVYKQSFVDYSNNSNISQQTYDLQIDDQSFEVWVQTGLTDYRYPQTYD